MSWDANNNVTWLTVFLSNCQTVKKLKIKVKMFQCFFPIQWETSGLCWALKIAPVRAWIVSCIRGTLHIWRTHTVNRFQNQSSAVLDHTLCKVFKVGFIFLIPRNLLQAFQNHAAAYLTVGRGFPVSGTLLKLVLTDSFTCRCNEVAKSLLSVCQIWGVLEQV